MLEGLIVFYVIFMAALLLIWHYYRVFSGKTSCDDCGCKCEDKGKDKHCPSKKNEIIETK